MHSTHRPIIGERLRGDDTMKLRSRGSRSLLSTGIALTLALGMLGAGRTVMAAGPQPVGLGTAYGFAVLAGTPAVTNTGPTTIIGDLGIHPAAAVTGFPPGVIVGTIHAADAVAGQAKIDLTAAYFDAAGRPSTATHGTLGGLTLVGGVYSAGGVTLDLTGTLTLDGENDPDSVWVFQATSDLITASSSSVRFVNGAQPCNVFWQVTSSATLGSGSSFAGTIMATTSITLNSGVTVSGRVLARNGTVTLINDTVMVSPCSTPAPTAAPTAGPTPTPTATPSAGPTASPAATVTPTASPTVTPTASPTATPGSTPTATPSSTPTASPTARPTPPTTATLAAIDAPGSGPTAVAFVAVVIFAFVVASRRSLRAIRIR
jgi:hypothetical protein